MTDLHIMIDIEALGLRPGSSIVQLGACAFSFETGRSGATFHRHIKPHPSLHAELETLRWHEEQGTFPVTDAQASAPSFLEHALRDFHQWIEDLGGDITTYWSWGATYDFPLLTEAANRINRPLPWKYHQCSCARTVWRMAFPGIRHGTRPHHALGDALGATTDLLAATKALADGVR